MEVTAENYGTKDFRLGIVGESNYQRALRRAKAAGEYEADGTGIIRVLVLTEPNNPYDSNAVRIVSVFGETLGYLSREDAEVYVDVITGMEQQGKKVTCEARLYGGTPDKPSIGAWLDLADPDEFE